eukprot:363193-Chlamydomonas_euryale.AAC.10
MELWPPGGCVGRRPPNEPAACATAAGGAAGKIDTGAADAACAARCASGLARGGEGHRRHA